MYINIHITLDFDFEFNWTKFDVKKLQYRETSPNWTLLRTNFYFWNRKVFTIYIKLTKISNIGTLYTKFGLYRIQGLVEDCICMMRVFTIVDGLFFFHFPHYWHGLFKNIYIPSYSLCCDFYWVPKHSDHVVIV